MNKEALYYESLPDNKVICKLCPAYCNLSDKKAGICKSRKNIGGKLITDNYGEMVALAIDPIEKKPLYHFHPGSNILSTGANYCNMGCLHCQNWSISQKKAPTKFFSPEQLVNTALNQNSIGVAFTYTEPIIWFEYIKDCAVLLKEAGLKVVLISNGYINPDPLKELIELVDAANIDLKSMSDDFYKRICKAKLNPVLETLKTLAASDVHLEITNLIIPGENDSDTDIKQLVDFVSSLSDRIPLHLSAYHPEYKMNAPVSDKKIMLNAYKIASDKLKYVYIGNLANIDKSNTYCPNCNSLLVKRNFYSVSIENIKSGVCEKCQSEIDFVFV